MEANLYTFLHFVRSVFTSMPVGLQVCVMYSFSSLLTLLHIPAHQERTPLPSVGSGVFAQL